MVFSSLVGPAVIELSPHQIEVVHCYIFALMLGFTAS